MKLLKRSALGILALLVVAGIGWAVYSNVAVSQQQPSIELSPDQDLLEPDVSVNGTPVSGEQILLLQANGMSRGEAIDAAIANTVILISADRLGIALTDEEVRTYIDRYEQRLSDAPSEERINAEAILQAQGLPLRDLASDPGAFKALRTEATLARVRDFLLERLAVSELTGTLVDQIDDAQALEALKAGLDSGALEEAKGKSFAQLEGEVQRFIQQERAAADIVVQDPAPR